ncbi:alpha/beta hydrolase [Vibrio sp. S4M6]|uniref:alpha/beta fold hydrolase n=1 Tax=Vibrio sinus TaxID=2946865 RepID=UPI002029B7FC|nr:alpha/beta hydrolase [Vibrio sinus]MCL9780763.1 alpha/beta hydrolase [Vibrio sinus]
MKWRVVFATLGLLLVVTATAYIVTNPGSQSVGNPSKAAIEGNMVTLSDGNTYYRFKGPENGELVVLVHGGTIPHWAWDKQVEALVGDGFRVLSYDKYGRGYSDRPDIEYSQDLYYRQLRELVDKLAISKPFHLAGVSLGAGTAVNFAARHPNRVNKFIVISPVVYQYPVPTVFKIPLVGEIVARFAGINTLVDRFTDLYGKSPQFEHYLGLYKEQLFSPGFQQSMLSMLRSDALGDYRSAYDSVARSHRESLLIWGQADTEISKGMIDEIRSRMPDAKFVAIDNAGHGALFQQADKINSYLLEFLR